MRAEPKIKVLHIDSEKSWRGGENQMALFIKGSASQVESFLACPEDSIASKRLESHARIIHVKFKAMQLLSSASYLAQLCKRESISIIDCQSSKAHSLGLLLKYMYPPVALIVHRRVDFAPGSGYFNRLKYLSSRVNKFVPISHAIAKILQDYGIPKESISTVRSATEDVAFRGLTQSACRSELAKELGITDGIPLVINVAYHTEQKGIPTLIYALAKLRDQGVPCLALLAGDGELHQSLIALAKSLSLREDHIRFLGIRSDIPKLITACDVFAFPSNKEGLGTSLLDAIHGGCAVAASNVGGIPEIILDQQTGLLSEPGDSDGLARNIRKILSDSALKERLILQAKDHVNAKFSVETMVRENLAIYRSQLSQK